MYGLKANMYGLIIMTSEKLLKKMLHLLITITASAFLSPSCKMFSVQRFKTSLRRQHNGYSFSHSYTFGNGDSQSQQLCGRLRKNCAHDKKVL